jgi:molybdate/tungstate transport system permease protein
VNAPRRNRMRRAPASPAHPHGVLVLCWLLGGMLGFFILAPLLALAVAPSAASLAAAARSTALWQALELSFEAALLTAVVAALFGVPLAYLLARGSFPAKSAVGALIDLPLAVPHTVAGIALLLVLGRDGFVGGPAATVLGIRFWGTLAGIVAAMLFVSVPYMVNAARIAFEDIDPRLEKIARTLGMGPWRVWLRITLPSAWRGIVTGLSLTYARAISEFGAVMILAYYPMTAPVWLYTLFVSDGLEEAAEGSLLLLVLCLSLFVLFRHFAYGGRAAQTG